MTEPSAPRDEDSSRPRVPGRTGAAPRRGRDPFGDVLPDRTRDEEAAAWGEPETDDDERIRREVPPHHG